VLRGRPGVVLGGFYALAVLCLARPAAPARPLERSRPTATKARAAA